MEQLIFVLILLGIIVLIMLLQYINSKKNDKLYLIELNKNFGKSHRFSPEKNYDKKRLINAPGYFKRHKVYGQLDDITWGDLSMDEVFASMDDTRSDIGCELLYYMLRTPLLDEELIQKRQNEIAFWREAVELRNSISLSLRRMGWLRRASVYESLDALKDLEGRGLCRYYIHTAVLLISAGLIYPLGGYGVIIFVAVLIYNLAVYYRERTITAPYLRVLDCVLRLMSASEEIRKELIKGGREEVAYEISEALNSLKSFKRRNGIVKNAGGGANPLTAVIELAGSIFFADLIRFWRMKEVLCSSTDAVDGLIGHIGSLDAYISMAGFVESLEGNCCKPEFMSGEAKFRNRLCIKETYHSLLEAPVPNSIETKHSILLTGSNASGKSTFLRTIALDVIMAQTLGYVTAKSYEAPIYVCMSSMSVKDDISTGDSYYMAEIRAVKRILEGIEAANAGGLEVICFVDELLRGTNTTERIAASASIMMKLDKSGALVCSATHDLELTELLKESFDNYHFEEELTEGDVRFSYDLQPGAARSRNAILLLDAMGYESSIVKTAMDMVGRYEKTGRWSENL